MPQIETRTWRKDVIARTVAGEPDFSAVALADINDDSSSAVSIVLTVFGNGMIEATAGIPQ
jgi:hypothetical protein